MSNPAEYHRTFETFSMSIWPIWKKDPEGWYVHTAFPERAIK